MFSRNSFSIIRRTISHRHTRRNLTIAVGFLVLCYGTSSSCSSSFTNPSSSAKASTTLFGVPSTSRKKERRNAVVEDNNVSDRNGDVDQHEFYNDDDEDDNTGFTEQMLKVTDLWERRHESTIAWDIIDLIRGGGAAASGTSSSSVESNRPMMNNRTAIFEVNFLDRAARLAVVCSGIGVGLESLGTLLRSNDFALMDKLISRLLSKESAKAVKSVRTIITQLDDHGVENVFQKYRPKEITYSILALAKLQRAAAYFRETTFDHKQVNDFGLLQDLAHYAVYANAAYGWTLDLALSGKVNMGGDLETLLTKTGIDPAHVIAFEREARTHRPAFFVVRDVEKERIVLCIRGTLSARDVLTDLCCVAEDFCEMEEEDRASGNKQGRTRARKRENTKQKTTTPHRAHQGMLESARGVALVAESFVVEELRENPTYSLVIVGHSMGGGVAAILGTLWERKFPGLMVYGYGSPCVGVADTKPTQSSNVISVVGEGDPFSCLSLGHVADISAAIARLCEDEELRTIALMRTDDAPEDMEASDLSWCYKTMQQLHYDCMTNEKMYPPGRIMYLRRYLDGRSGGIRSSSTIREPVLLEYSKDDFRDLRLHPRMMDVTRHVPTVYETILQEMAEGAVLEKEAEEEQVEF